jgi:hypothetical protein
MRTRLLKVLSAIMLFFMPTLIYAIAPPVLGATANFALFTASGALTTDGATVVTGNIASYDVTPVGFVGPGTVVGTIFPVGSASNPAFADVGIAYSDLFNRIDDDVIGTPLETGTLTPGTLHPGVHTTVGAALLSGNLILDGGGDANAIFIIKIKGAFTTSAGTNITLINKAQLCNVFWQVDSWVDLGAGSAFIGTIVGGGAIALGEAASLHGRALTTAGAINLHNNVVNFMPEAAGSITGTAAVCQ